MLRPFRTLLRRATPLLLLPLLPACSTTTPPQRFPGLADSSSSTHPAIVRESEEMILSSVDRDADDSHHLVTGHVPLTRRTYHQYKIPAGKHTFYVVYNNRSLAGVDTNSDLISFSATLLPDHNYTLASSPKGVAVQGPFSNNPIHFNPCLIDDATHQAIASAIPAK